jgi:hypothetical protein
MICYLCKTPIKSSVRVFLKAKNGREKDGRRDVCESCYKRTKEKDGYKLNGNMWTK